MCLSTYLFIYANIFLFLYLCLINFVCLPEYSRGGVDYFPLTEVNNFLRSFEKDMEGRTYWLRSPCASLRPRVLHLSFLGQVENFLALLIHFRYNRDGYDIFNVNEVSFKFSI